MELTLEERSAGTLSPQNLRLAVRTFDDVGFVVLEDAFEKPFLDTIRAAYEAQLHAFLEGRGGLDALEGKTFGKNHIGFHPPLLFPLADERIVAHPVAVQLMTELLGDSFQCGFYNTNTAMPGSGIQPIHADTRPLFGAALGVPHPVATLVVNIPLCDFTLENGSTEVWPGTHRFVDTTPKDERTLEERARDLPSVRTNFKVGSLVLRDMRMWHRGMPNRADYPRTMIALVYERGFKRTDTLEVPRSTYEAWSETTRKIFRNNPVIEDAKIHETSNYRA
jgi:ectoine hydroxylase-related dioxygenase (phytanoyl-CoA dioxygenase family)